MPDTASRPKIDWCAIVSILVLVASLTGVFVWDTVATLNNTEVLGYIRINPKSLLASEEIADLDNEILDLFLAEHRYMLIDVAARQTLESDEDYVEELLQPGEDPVLFIKEHFNVRMRSHRFMELSMSVPKNKEDAGQALLDAIAETYIAYVEDGTRNRLERRLSAMEEERGYSRNILQQMIQNERELQADLRQLAEKDEELDGRNLELILMQEEIETELEHQRKLHREMRDLASQGLEPSGLIYIRP